MSALFEKYKRSNLEELASNLIEKNLVIKEDELNAENREPFESKVKQQGEVLEGEPI